MKLNILGNHPLGQPDPFIYKDNNIYYIITSGTEGVHCYKSNKLDGDYVKKVGFSFDCKCFFGSVRVFGKDDSVVEGGTGEIKKDKKNKNL